jgi:hypothetical protein
VASLGAGLVAATVVVLAGLGARLVEGDVAQLAAFSAGLVAATVVVLAGLGAGLVGRDRGAGLVDGGRARRPAGRG